MDVECPAREDQNCITYDVPYEVAVTGFVFVDQRVRPERVERRIRVIKDQVMLERYRGQIVDDSKDKRD